MRSNATTTGYTYTTPTADDLLITIDGSEHTDATLVPMGSTPSTALAAPEATGNASSYRLVFHLENPAAGSETLFVTYAPLTLYGAHSALAFLVTSFTTALTDLRPPEITTSTFTPTALAPEGHAVNYTITLAFSEPVATADGSGEVSHAHFALTVGGTRVTAGADGPFAIDVNTSNTAGARRSLHGGTSDVFHLTSVASNRRLSTSTVELHLALSPSSMPGPDVSVVLTPIAAAITDGSGNLLVATPIVCGSLQLSTISLAPPPVLLLGPSPSGLPPPPAPPFAPPSAPQAPPVGPGGLAAMAANGMLIGGVSSFLAVLMLLVCFISMVLFSYCLYRKRKRKHDTHVKAETELGALLQPGEEDQPDDTERRSRMLYTLQDILMRAKNKPIAEATEEVVQQGSVLPPLLSIALAKEWRARHNNDPDADPPTDTEKIELLREMMRGPPKPPTPPSVLLQAHGEFERVHLRPAVSEHEALLFLKGALEQAAPNLPQLAEEGLVDTIEEQDPIKPGWDGGGGVRMRPPHLKAARGDNYFIEPPPPPPKTEGLEVTNLPLVVLEASTALFSHATAPLMPGTDDENLIEALGSLKQRLDGILASSRVDPTVKLADGESDAVADGLAQLPPGIVDAANGLFVGRNGRMPASDFEAIQTLHDVLDEAGVASGSRKSRWRAAVAALPPPPPPMYVTKDLPTSVQMIASALLNDPQFKNLPPEMREQKELLELEKKVHKVLELKLPRLVLSMARAAFEVDEQRGAESDVEAVTKLIDQISEATVGDVKPGWDGGGGARVFAPRLKPPPSDGPSTAWRDVAPPASQVDMSKLPEVATRAAAALDDQAAAADPQAGIRILRDRLREYAEGMVQPEALQQARFDFREVKGKAAASDREVVAELGKWIEKAKAAEIDRGWNGGGGVRVGVPKLQPVEARPKAGTQPDGGGVVPSALAPPPRVRPLQIGALPLGIIKAVIPLRGAAAGSSILANVIDGGDGAAAAPKEPGFAYDPTNLTPHLGQLLTRLDRALDTSDALGFLSIAKPVHAAAESLFVARNGNKPTDEREALALLRTVLEEGGVRRDSLEERDDGGASRSGGGVSAFGGPMPDFVLRAAMGLDGGGMASSASVPTDNASKMQLVKLHEVLSAVTTPDGVGRRAAESALPDRVAVALQAEFHTRVGGDEDASMSELVHIAKQLISEAEDVKRMAPAAKFDLGGGNGGSGRGSGRFSGFGGGGDGIAGPPVVLERNQSASSKKGKGPVFDVASAAMPPPGELATGGFSMQTDTASETIREDRRGSVVRNRKSLAGRASLVDNEQLGKRRASLFERNLSLQHLHSRKEEFDASVRKAAVALSIDEGLQHMAEEAPSVDELLETIDHDLEGVEPTSPLLGERSYRSTSSRRSRDRSGRLSPSASIRSEEKSARMEESSQLKSVAGVAMVSFFHNRLGQRRCARGSSRVHPASPGRLSSPMKHSSGRPSPGGIWAAPRVDARGGYACAMEGRRSISSPRGYGGTESHAAQLAAALRPVRAQAEMAVEEEGSTTALPPPPPPLLQQSSSGTARVASSGEVARLAAEVAAPKPPPKRAAPVLPPRCASNAALTRAATRPLPAAPLSRQTSGAVRPPPTLPPLGGLQANGFEVRAEAE